MLTLEMIVEAQNTLRDIAVMTPLSPAKNLGANIYIKSENLQRTGAFKLRGAYNKLRSLSPEERGKGVIACSAGNHAQGIALSAARLGIRSIICMPAGAPISKIEATRSYGADVVLVPGVYDDASAEAIRLAGEKGYTFAHPFNDELVVAGQGTIGAEILDQMPEVEQVVVSIGGGGLIGGIACAIKARKPSCRVVGVQAEGAAAMYTSLQSNRLVELADVSTIADGIAVKRPGDFTFDLCRKYVDEVVTVRDDEIAAAVLALMEDQKTVAEGAGAAPIAAVMFGKISHAHLKTVCVVSGGNVDTAMLSRILTKGLLKMGRIAEITAKIADKPGSLMSLMRVISSSGANIISINHDRQAKHSDVNTCIVSMVLETGGRKHIARIKQELRKGNIQVF